MQLQPVSDFFNFSNNPWVPVAVPRYGGWLPPGLAYNSCIHHIYHSRAMNKMERPAKLVLWTCASVKDGSMDILLYAGNADLPWVDYPWKDGNMVELAILHILDTRGSVVNRGKTVSGEAIDALMEMAGKADELRFGVACRSTDGGKMLWHSAQMSACYF